MILLHGLLRSPASLNQLEQALRQEGYITVNQGYPSRDYPIEELAPIAIDPALEHCPEGSDINFVTHSLGGILVRQYASLNHIPNLKRVVMLGPPNKGSEVVDELEGFYGFEWINGQAGLQLGTSKTSVPNQLGAVNFDLGVIAGNRSINWILSGLIPGEDDGKVSIESTKIDGMNEHLVLPVNHAMMMDNESVIKAVILYLEQGHWSTQNDISTRTLP
ncbi:esterase/lipase family protein [Candidatus Pelagadaptatus aseana]|uniref:esterase/lipase family protein n=1 Tax=Candidatus Pelagadaptatus aseana TaxID=3120508 RepID=UPI003C6F2A34